MVETKSKRLALRILDLEVKVHEKMQNALITKVNFEVQIKNQMLSKDKVYQEFYEAQRLKERQESEYSMRLSSIQDHLNVLDHKLNE